MSEDAWRPASRPPEVLDAGPLQLRRVRTTDAPEVFAAVSSSLDHLRPFLPWARSYDRGAADGFVAHAEQGWADGEAFEFGMHAPGAPGELGEPTLAGMCGLMARIGPGALEIGYWVRAGQVRRGFATAAARALTTAALALPEVDRVEIHVDAANEASAAVPRRLGYRLVETREAPAEAPGESGRQLIWELRQ